MLKLHEIAKIAGVSPATVSLVLHNRKGVGKTKRAAIEKILRENGYGISQETQITRRFGFLKYINDAKSVDGNPGFITAIMDAAESECRNNGFSLTVTTFTDIPDTIDFVNRQMPDGVILLGTEMNEDDMRYFHRLKVPFVVVDNLMALTPCHAVTMDNYSSIFSSVQHFVGLGHRKIGFLRTPSFRNGNCAVRMRSFVEAIEHFKLDFDPGLVYDLNSTLNDSYRQMCRYIKGGAKFPSAIVSSCDVSALGALKAFEEYGIRVPQDISVIGFDDIAFSEISNPPLTTVNVPCEKIGVWAVQLLKQQLENSPVSAYIKMQVSTTLTLRSSTRRFEKSSDNPHILP
jgi:LacI family transcriptional regulator